MTPEELYDWINSLPGKTMQQKLNLAQDLADAYNIDLFGANEPFVPEQYIPQPGYTGMIWGEDPVMGPIFTAIDSGMSPAEAVRAARENPDLKGYFPAAGQDSDMDYLKLAADYQRELLENQFAEQQFQMQQANKQAIYEGKQPLGLPGEAMTMYEAVGQPSLDELMNMYIGGLDQFRDQGYTDLIEFERQPGAAVQPAAGWRLLRPEALPGGTRLRPHPGGGGLAAPALAGGHGPVPGQGTGTQRGTRREDASVPDVHAFPGHIACDAASASELVVPVKRDGQVIAVIDLDSPTLNRFDAEDAAGIEALAAAIAESI